MKTIAVLLNEPEVSRDLIVYAAHLAKDLKATIQLLYIQTSHTYVSHGVIDLPPAQVEATYELNAGTAKKKTDEILLEIGNEIPEGTVFDWKSEIGIAGIVLGRKVETGEIDMVLLKGNPDEAFWFQTSSNMDIIRDVKCPVWIIPHDIKYHPLKRIVYATDYIEEDINTLRRLIDMAGSFVSEITAVHISERDDFAEKIKLAGFDDLLKKRAGFDNVRAKCVIHTEGHDLAKILNEEAVREDADLIVVLKENRNFFERIFRSSFTGELIKKADLPVLVFHEK